MVYQDFKKKLIPTLMVETSVEEVNCRYSGINNRARIY